MTRRALPILLLVIVAACGAKHYSSPTEPPTTFTAGAEGFIREGATTGPAVPGATVKVGNKTNVTATDGSFAITGLTSGTVSVTVSKSGYQDNTFQVTLAGGQNRFNWTLTKS